MIYLRIVILIGLQSKFEAAGGDIVGIDSDVRKVLCSKCPML